MPVNSFLASRLLPLASSTELVDMLLNAAGDVQAHPHQKFQGVWSPEVSSKLVKGPLSKAVAVVSHPRTHPEVLAKFAKDARVSVRHALLANEATPYDTVKSLTSWALSRKDSYAVQCVFHRLSAEDIVAALRGLSEGELRSLTGKSGDVLSPAKVAHKCLQARETALAVAALSWPKLAQAMAVRHLAMSDPPLPLRDLVEAMPEEARVTAVFTAVTRCSTLTVELAELCREYPDGYGDYAKPGENATLFETGALSILARLESDNLSFALACGLEEADVLNVIAEAKPAEIPVLVTSMASRGYTAKVEQALARRVIAVGGDLAIAQALSNPGSQGTVGALLRLAGHPLPAKLVMSLLRHGSTQSTRSWLLDNQRKPNHPVPGQLPALLHKPGSAFTTLERTMDRSYRWQTITKTMSREEIPAWLANALRGAYTPALAELDREVLADVRTLLDSELVGNLTQPAVGQVAMSYLEDVFGSDRQQWETFLTLASDWAGGFADLVDATMSLTGIPARELAESVPQAIEEPTLI